MVIAAPECLYGYSETQLKSAFSEAQFNAFNRWMVGQTFSSCDGRQYNYTTKEYEATDCGPHGYVFYLADVNRFLRSMPFLTRHDATVAILLNLTEGN